MCSRCSSMRIVSSDTIPRESFCHIVCLFRAEAAAQGCGVTEQWTGLATGSQCQFGSAGLPSPRGVPARTGAPDPFFPKAAISVPLNLRPLYRPKIQLPDRPLEDSSFFVTPHPPPPPTNRPTMPLLRLRTLTRTIPGTPPCRRLTTTPLRRFPTVPGQPAPEVYTSKARPSSVHASPESDAGRSYIPRSSTASSSSSSSTPLSSTGSKPTILDAVKEEGAERFDGPARPRMRYERPKEARELPDVPSRWRHCAFSLPFPLPAFFHPSNSSLLQPSSFQTSPSRHSPSSHGPSSSCTSQTPNGSLPLF